MSLKCDLAVIGAGMAGLTAAGWAAERGATVVVIEKAPAIGGSAILSGGVVWTATSAEKMQLHGRGQPSLAQVVLDEYPVAIEWLRSRGIEMSPAMTVLHGRGYQIDIINHFEGCRSLVTQHGGHVVVDTTTTALLTGDDGRVLGVRTSHPDGEIDVHADWTMLATGGYQGAPELRARFIHENARNMRLRANTTSAGDALSLARQAGADVRGTNPGFYGHLVSECPQWGDPRLFTMLTQYHSDHALLFNEGGLRFCDESLGDHTNTYFTVLQDNARALCFWDARVQADHATQPLINAVVPMDKIATALEHGGKGVAGATLDQIAAFASAQGFDGARMLQSIHEYNERARNGWEKIRPPRAENGEPLDKAPFYALIVHPAITCTYGGLSIDPDARVLRPDGTPVPGLLAAGADAGDAFGIGYAGGLALAMAFGLRGAKTAGWR